MRLLVFCCWLGLLGIGCSSVSGQSSPRPNPQLPLGSIIDRVGNQLDSAQYDSAQYYLNLGFQRERESPNPELAFYLSAYQSELFYYNALFEQGIQYALKGLRQAEARRDSTMMANQHNLLGILYTELGQLTKAISHLRRSLQLLPERPVSRYGLTRRYQILSNLGQCYDQVGQYDRAISSNKASFAAANRFPSARGSSIAAWALGNDYLAIHLPEQAKRWYHTALTLALNARDYDAAIVNYPALCKLLLPTQPEQARLYLEKGVQLMASHPDRISTHTKRLFAEQQADLYFRMKNYPRAVDYHRLLEQINREITGKEKSQRLAMLQAYYENERQLLQAEARDKAQEEELRRSRMTTIATAGLAILLLFGLLAVYYGYRQKQRVNDLLQQQRISELEQKQEIAALKAMITGEERERVRIARELHDGLSGLLAAARYQVEGQLRQLAGTPLNAPVQLLDQARQEVRRISHNLMPYTLQNFGLIRALREYVGHLNGADGFRVRFTAEGPEPPLNPTEQLWLYRCVQELLTNALRHGKASRVRLDLCTAGTQLSVTVTDDGLGFDPAAGLASDGNGLRNIQTRLTHLGGLFELSSAPGQGTTIQLTVPLTLTVTEA